MINFEQVSENGGVHLDRNEDWSGDAFIREQNTPETGLSQGIRVPGKLLLAIARRTIIGDFGDQEP